jgi:hypothetical protein
MVMVGASYLEEERSITPQEAEKVLGILCVKYGFCLPPLWQARLRDCPPRSISKFTDTVFHAEGLDPRTADTAMYKAMVEEVRLAFERSGKTGGMPSNTSLERTRDR